LIEAVAKRSADPGKRITPMSQKPRIKVPDTTKVGDVIEIKTLISHIMETGERKDKDGKTIARNIINTFTATYNGKEFFKAELQPGISANPYIAFFLKVPAPGELELSWLDDVGERVVEKVKLNVS
jgi:sulfur-oxidizing protein SoxZ